jgi:peroxiredoxin
MDRPSLKRQLNYLLIGLLIGAAFTVVIAFGLPERDSQSAPTATPGGELSGIAVAPQAGALAPAFTLQDLDGKSISLSDFHGQVVLLNFWAVWCSPCLVEMPMFEARYQSLKDDGFIVLGVNFDDPPEDVRIYGEALELTFPLVLDPGGVVQDLYRIRGYPSSVIIDGDGVVQVVQVGLMTDEQLDGYLEEMGF